jgi:hypothetical protein
VFQGVCSFMTEAVRRRVTPFAAVATVLLASTLLPSASAQVTTPPTALDKQLARLDFGIAGSGQFTTNTSGNTATGQQVFLSPSNTLGALVQLRYTVKPLVGLEFNYNYARYTENFQFTNTTPNGASLTVLGVQTNASEYSFGYLIHTPNQYYGLQPYLSVGAGSIDFHPTNGGGEGFLPQARAAYYYNVGVEQHLFESAFGARAGFRQVFSLAPDYKATYLRDHQRNYTSQPYFGVFVTF